MAGNSNSGGNRRLSDAEKIARGTFRKDQSEAVYNARAAEKVITGVFFTEIPQPTMPLNDYGRATYEKWARILLDQGKLTSVMVEHCQTLGIIDMRINGKLSAGKSPTADDMKQRTSVIRLLGVAENATVIAGAGQKNKFANCGFSSSKVHQVGLRSYRSSGDDL